MPEVLDAVASVGRAATDSEEKTVEAPRSAPSSSDLSGNVQLGIAPSNQPRRAHFRLHLQPHFKARDYSILLADSLGFFSALTASTSGTLNNLVLHGIQQLPGVEHTETHLVMG